MGDALYRKLGDVHVEMMSYQLGYPPDTVIGGCTIQIYRDVLGQLIAWALQARDRGEAATRDPSTPWSPRLLPPSPSIPPSSAGLLPASRSTGRTLTIMPPCRVSRPLR